MALGRRRAAPGPPTYVMGAGAQKAGTSWLHDYLASSPQCAVGYRKEYHVFDALDLPSEQWKRDNIVRRAREELDKAAAGRRANASALHRMSMLCEPDFYFDHFVGLLARDPGYRMTLDLTPGYGMLSAKRMRWIKDGFAARGVRTVSVFLMRDPVERIWSHLRMEKSRRPERYPDDSATHLLEVYARESFAERTRYDATLAALDRVFAPEELHLGFYETLFRPQEVDAVCRLVGITPVAADFATRVNATPRTAEHLPDDTVRRVAEHYRGVYLAVAQRVPDVDLAAIWPSSRYALA